MNSLHLLQEKGSNNNSQINFSWFNTKFEVESGNHGSLWFLYRETRFTQRLSPNPPRDQQLGSQGVSAGVLGRLPKSWTPKFHRRGSIPWSCKSPRSSMIILDPWWSPKIFPTYLQLWSRIPWPSSAYHAQDNRRPGPPPASKPDRPRWTQGQWSLFSQKWVGYVIDNLYNQSYLHTVILYIYIYYILYNIQDGAKITKLPWLNYDLWIFMV